MANDKDKHIEYVGDSRVPAKRAPNISPSYSEFPGKNEPFWPNFLLKEWMVAAVCLVAYLILTVSHPAPLGDKADPTDTNFTPLPDWYFLFLYQLLKYPWASGDWVVLGTVVLPGLLFGGLLIAPFLDSGPERRASKRPVSTGLMLLGIVVVAYLTWESMAQHNAHEAAKNPPSAEQPTPHDPSKAAPVETDDPGASIWQAQVSCQACHGVDMSGGGGGPALTDVGSRLSAEEIKNVIEKGRGMMPPGQFNGSQEELEQLATYLAGLK
jgi:menaquinol-cytochrome c reductase cytochrome b/c subunit